MFDRACLFVQVTATPPRSGWLQRLNNFRQRNKVKTQWLDQQAGDGSWTSRLVAGDRVVVCSSRWPRKQDARDAAAEAFLRRASAYYGGL